MKKLIVFALTLITLFLLAACSGTQPPAAEDSAPATNDTMADEMMTDETMTDDSHDDMVSTDEMMNDNSHDNTTNTDEMMSNDNHDDMMSDAGMSEMGSMADAPDWQNIELTDARTGENFTLASFSGKTIFVEPMATWCTNCRQQLGNVHEARAQLGDEVIFIGLSLETNLDSADLAQYQSDQGFDWTFAVMTPEMLQSLADTFGRSITVAPNTPHFVIRADGSYTELVTGIDSPDQLVQQIQAASS
ncbi:MAG: hypothetical protein H6667_08600 [Ardenticatenaceae bacterium]|nr:hypothetical protein [Ardenticatenaceae bacterium]MCB9445807.1 hypothetical protein [Ardenticatenaceae bacterium]